MYVKAMYSLTPLNIRRALNIIVAIRAYTCIPGGVRVSGNSDSSSNGSSDSGGDSSSGSSDSGGDSSNDSSSNGGNGSSDVSSDSIPNANGNTSANIKKYNNTFKNDLNFIIIVLSLFVTNVSLSP